MPGFVVQDYQDTAKRFITALSQRRFDEASKQFDEKMAKALPPGKLQNTWNGLLQQVGDFEQILDVHTQEKEGYQVVFVTCSFAKGNLDVKVVYDSTGHIAGLSFVPPQSSYASWSLPAYVRPAQIREQSVTVGKSPWELPGVLTLPSGTGPFPGVVLVHGSGPLDMDETIGPNKPFKDLAWGLASQGIAILRYTKRTSAYGAKFQKEIPLFTVRDEVMDDARAAIELVARTPGVSSKQIFLIGHSLGGMLAPRIASTDPEISGIIILAGPSRSIQQSLVDQTKYFAKLMPDSKEAAEAVKRAEETAHEIESSDLRSTSIIDFWGAHIPGSYWLDLRNYNAVESAERLKIPILVIQGGRDYEVSAADFQGWKVGMVGHSNSSFRFYENLNHLLVAGSGVSTPAEYDQPGHVAQEVIDAIGEWIIKQQVTSSN